MIEHGRNGTALRSGDAETADVEVEAAAVGALLSGRAPVLALAREMGVHPIVFSDSHHRTVAQAVLELDGEGQAVDLITVGRALGRRKAPRGGWPDFLAGRLDRAVPTNAPAYFKSVVVAWQRRAAVRAAGAMAEAVESAADSADPWAVAAEAFDRARIGYGAGAPADLIGLGELLDNEPEQADPILRDLYEVGDKVALVGPSKTRKSFLALQMALSVAAGRPCVAWFVPRARRVLLAQLEIKAGHMHRRVRRTADAMGLTHDELTTARSNLAILNGRGKGLTVEAIGRAADRHGAELLVVDPLYKLGQGDELVEDMKATLQAFDVLIARTGAAVLYVHHDAKGAAGDRDIRDRGAGSGVFARDYDACLTLTPHRDDTDTVVVDALLRNFAPRPPVCIRWNGGRFEVDAGMDPIPMTSRNRNHQDKHGKAIVEYLTANPGASTRQVAQAVGCDHSTVVRRRKGLLGGGA